MLGDYKGETLRCQKLYLYKKKWNGSNNEIIQISVKTPQIF